MVLLTAEEIATALLGGTYSEPLAEINPYVVEDVGRREYPSIDVDNITDQERLRDVPTSKDKQIYLVHLYYRITGFGDADVPQVKLLEDEIFAVIDALQTTDTKIAITESWKRETLTSPTAHIHSTLRVTTEEIFSEIEGGVPGDKITITFPVPLSETFDVVNLITDRLEALKEMDYVMTDTGTENEEVYSLIRAHGLLDVEIIIKVTDEANLDSFFDGDDHPIILTKNGTAIGKTANFITRTHSTPRSEIQKTVISMDIK